MPQLRQCRTGTQRNRFPQVALNSRSNCAKTARRQPLASSDLSIPAPPPRQALAKLAKLAKLSKQRLTAAADWLWR